MGVKGLWDLLAPAGRRVSAANLKGKIVAVDAAIWLVQVFLRFRSRVLKGSGPVQFPAVSGLSIGALNVWPSV